MDAVLNFLYGAGLIAIVVALFNIIIFVHELGHFLAARWRGLRVDRFQIWFGKPIWKKEVNGVQYGLGWIPAGGFVALPQMAPMESVEGTNREDGVEEEPLPPVRPLDKIIVAFAGPLFSFLLALTAACLVSWVGKPRDFMEVTTVGYVPQGGVAEAAGFKVGDKIVEVNGKPVNGFMGSPAFDSVRESVMLSEGDRIEFKVKRPGVEGLVPLETEFEIPSTPWWERKGLRSVGIGVENRTVFSEPIKDGPAEKAGIKPGDEVLEVNGEKMRSALRFREVVENSEGKALVLKIKRKGELIAPITVTPRKPTNVEKAKAMIGVGFVNTEPFIETLYYPGPFQQVGDSVRMMGVTIAKIATPKSDVGVQHLAGPVGIGNIMFNMLKTPNGWKRLLWFMVLFNVNLAILNMLPLPVLDGGHIMLAIGEMIAGRPVKARLLEVVQTCFALLLLGLFLFITSKDIGDLLGIGRGGGPTEYEWPEDAGG